MKIRYTVFILICMKLSFTLKVSADPGTEHQSMAAWPKVRFWKYDARQASQSTVR
jgi:hypothetical protein